MTQPKVPPTQPHQHADYGSHYEQARPAVSPEDAALSEKDREKALIDQNKALGDDDPLKCTRAPFFHPYLLPSGPKALGSHGEGVDRIRKGGTLCFVSWYCFLDKTLRGLSYILLIG